MDQPKNPTPRDDELPLWAKMFVLFVLTSLLLPLFIWLLRQLWELALS